MDSLRIGLSSWIIQDGNYPDFRIGEVVRLALELYPRAIQASSNRSISCAHLGASDYRVSARVVFATRKLFVLDFGVLAYYQTAPLSWLKKGTWVDADIYLGIDPFFYFEELYAIKGMPEVRYEFRISGIELETTPWISTCDSSGRTINMRDETQRSYRQVAETEAWQDDGGNAHYVLSVERIIDSSR